MSVVYELDRAAGYLIKIVEATEDLRRKYDRGPASGSLMERQLEATSAPLREHYYNATSLGWLRLVAAEEHLYSIARLLPDQKALYSIYTLVRTAAELSARAAWLLDPSIDATTRAERSVAERLDSFDEAGRLGAAAKKEAGEKARALKHEAHADGLTTYKSGRSPSAMQLLDEIYGADRDGDRFGPLVYRLLSAFTHGTQYALHRLAREETKRPSDIEGLVEVKIGTTASEEAQMVLIGLIAWNQAIDAQCALYGWDAQKLGADVAYYGSELRRIMDEPVAGSDGEGPKDDREQGPAGQARR